MKRAWRSIGLTDDVLPAVVSGYTVSMLFLLCGLYTFITVLFPTPPQFRPGLVMLVAVAAVAFGLIGMRLPWARIPDGARLAIAPGAMALIALHNITAGMDAFRYGMFFFVVFIWLGLCEPRGTSLKMAPFLLVAYIAPLLADGASSSDLASISYTIPLYLTVGEVLAWRSARLHALKDRLQYLAEHDSLTGLPNRAMFTARLEASSGRASETAVIFLDLDGFKRINDRLGHAAGDEVLVNVAGALREAARPGDLPCRLAGDEFVILLVDTDLGTAEGVAQRLLDRMALLRAPDGTPIRGSVGIACSSAVNCHGIVAAADEAMYQAKNTRSGTVAVTVPAA
ncbi:GGDEF domain-containing protein [Actinoplanes oblitus]|uniref:GGDEF domain-containing protein n=1 Tax=Actinoplanes oblitus TaxID=3040509 RepID=A0ABY8W9E8_9ACTN|nr:GGDEF domain-containing protein [Actinoplanes oblitus]WIM93530.1 GGDEF domain-containing protein [Actinoplanes oblitus]